MPINYTQLEDLKLLFLYNNKYLFAHSYLFQINDNNSF